MLGATLQVAWHGEPSQAGSNSGRPAVWAPWNAARWAVLAADAWRNPGGLDCNKENKLSTNCVNSCSCCEDLGEVARLVTSN